MSAIDRLRARFDAPRFCPDDGQPIKVENIPTFDPTTGKPSDRWYWMCPDVSVEPTSRGTTWTQRATNVVHPHGVGRPRWHRTTETGS